MARKANLHNVIREIFALSGNCCAFPGCENPLINEDGKYVAEICHIEAANEKGQRFNRAQTDDQRRAAANLILLCSTHHRYTNDVEKYTVPVLKEMKKSHEAKFRNKPPVIQEKVLEDLSDIIQMQLDGLFFISKDTNTAVHEIRDKVNEIQQQLIIKSFSEQDKPLIDHAKDNTTECILPVNLPVDNIKGENTAENSILGSYAEQLLKSLSDIGKTSQHIFDVTIENSVSIGVIPVLQAESTDTRIFKTDFDTIKSYINENRLLIVEGDANSGKSILTKRITYFFCQEFLENKSNGIVPVLIDLKTFDPSARNLEELIIRELRANKINTTHDNLYSFLIENNFILVLDSYDECLNFERFKAEIYSIPKAITVIITSRSISEINLLKDLNPFVLKLGKLTDVEQKQIAKLYLKNSNKANIFISELKNQEIVGTEGNPLVLKLLLLYFNKQQRLTKNIYELYKFVLENLLSAESKPPEGINTNGLYSGIRKEFLRDFAFQLQRNNVTSTKLDRFEEFLNSWLTKKALNGKTGLGIAIKNNLVLSGFLAVKGEDISFFHRSFQDFFAAETDIVVNVSKKQVKEWFCSNYYHTFLKFYFARSRNIEYLRLFRPTRNRYFFYKRLSFITRIENYSACLAILNDGNGEEREILLTLIRSLLERFSDSGMSKVLFFHISFIAPALFRSLGYLNYRPATELFFNMVVPGKKMDEYALKAIAHFTFNPVDYNSLLDLSINIEKRYAEYENLVKQIKAHATGLGDLIIVRYKASTDESEKSRLRYFLKEHYTNHYHDGVMPARNVFVLILEIQLECGGFENYFRSLINGKEDSETNKDYKLLFYQYILRVFQNNELKQRKINALEALLLSMEQDRDFETIIDMGINDTELEVVLASIIWLPYVYKDKNLEIKYLNRLYELYEKIPEKRGKILNSINRVDHAINETEKTIIMRSIHGTTYQEVATALYLIKRFMFSETLPVLNELLAREDYILKIRCKVVETMIYLNPQLYIDGFNQKAINAYNEELANEVKIEDARKIMEDILQYIGDEKTLAILQSVYKKMEEDMYNKYAKAEYRKKPLNFEYPAKDISSSSNDFFPFHVSRFIDRIKMKLKHVEQFAGTTE